MKALVNVSKKAAIKAGCENWGYQVVDISLSELNEVQKNELSQHDIDFSFTKTHKHDISIINICLGYLDHKIEIDDTTQKSVENLLDKMIQKRLDFQKEKEKKEKESKIAEKEKVANFLHKSRDVKKYVSGYFRINDAMSPNCDRRNDQVKQRLSEINSEIERLEEIKEKQKTEREKMSQEKEESFLEWAKTEGSELLKARIEEDMNWIKLAQKEWAEKILIEAKIDISEFQHDYPHEYDDRENATLEEIKELQKMRKLFKGTNGKVELAWVTKENNEYYEEPEHFSAIVIYIDTPISGTISMIKEL